MSDAANPLDRVIQAIHDRVVVEGVYREKREDESWYRWACAYQHDVLGEEFDRG